MRSHVCISNAVSENPKYSVRGSKKYQYGCRDRNIERESIQQENPESGAVRPEERMAKRTLEKLSKFSGSRRHDEGSINLVVHNKEQEVVYGECWVSRSTCHTV